MPRSRAVIVEEVLDDVFPGGWANERLAEVLTEVYDEAMERYAEYGYTEEERDRFVERQVSNRIWQYYSGGDSCYSAGRRIVEDFGVEPC
jgi:hypothetical protein